VQCGAGKFSQTCDTGLVQCPLPGGPYVCPGEQIFLCGGEQPGGVFFCPTDKFHCNGGTLYDFVCSGSHECAGGFDCQANHIFVCSTAPTFNCGADGGEGFTCAGGGNRCNQPGVGGYGAPPDMDPRPGDFMCYGGPGSDEQFQCSPPFGCNTLDDFECRGDGTDPNFLCGATLFRCEPMPGGQFKCDTSNNTGGFKCDPAAAFDCGPANNFSPAYYP